MTKYLPSVLCVFITLCLSSTAFSQSAVDRYNTAKTQYENGNYAASIQTLKSLEQSIGANPKIQSLLVYAYVANNDFVNAKIELNKYKRKVPYSSSQAHKDLMALESNINQQLQQLEKNHTANIEATSMKKADEAIKTVYNTPERQRVIALQNENKKIVDDLEKKQKVVLEQQRVINNRLNEVKTNYTAEKNEFSIQESRAVKIGQQTWMAHNLNVSYFRNGDPIYQAKNDKEWKDALLIWKIPAWRYENDDERNASTSGKIYNYYAVFDSRGLAPEGWKIPNNENWQVFIHYIEKNNFNNEIQLKETWRISKYNGYEKLKGKNKTGFSARPGIIGKNIRFIELSNHLNESYWWSSTNPIITDYYKDIQYSVRLRYSRGNGKYLQGELKILEENMYGTLYIEQPKKMLQPNPNDPNEFKMYLLMGNFVRLIRE